MKQLYNILRVSVLCLTTPLANSVDLLVNTTSGFIQGQVRRFSGKVIYEFHNIPYAEPPVGARRFMPPEFKARMKGMINATNDTAIECPQIIPSDLEVHKVFQEVTTAHIPFTTQEDCLYLNVYAPSIINSDYSLPVMVWIHGGGYVFGSGRRNSGVVLSSGNDVIVVTINYRLGALGFLNTEDEHAVGNFGLLDQIMALKWVKANIAQFGGDVGRVTIAGESAGGASVSQLAISPLTRDLFQRAIIESGNPFSTWAFQPSALKNTKLFAANMGCPTQNTRSLVECLKLKTVDEIIDVQVKQTAVVAWAPRYKGEIFPETPLEIRNQLTSDVAERLAMLDILIGINTQEASIWFEQTVRPFYLKKGIPKDFFEFALSLAGAMQIPPEHIPTFLNTVRYKYTDWTMPTSSLSRARMLVDMMGDLLFNVGTVQFARLHNQVAPDTARGRTYMYQFDHRPSWMSQAPWRRGAGHVDELFFVFGNPYEFKLLNGTKKEEVLSQTTMTYWTNFVKTGNPNEPVAVPVKWPRYEEGEEKYLRLDTQMSNDSVDQGIFASRVAFWTEFIPQENRRLSQIHNATECEKVTPTSGSSRQNSTGLKQLIIHFILVLLLSSS